MANLQKYSYILHEYSVNISLNACDLLFLQSALQTKIQYFGFGEGLDASIAEVLLKRLEELKGKVEADKRILFAFSESQVRVLYSAVIDYSRMQSVWFSAFSKWKRQGENYSYL